MIGILLINDSLEGDFALGILMRALQADADAANAAFEQRARGIHDFGFGGGVISRSRLRGDEGFEDGAVRRCRRDLIRARA